MDKPLIRKRFSRAIGSYQQTATVQRDVARRMSELLRLHIPRDTCRNAIEVGCGTGLFTRQLLKEIHPQRLLLNDICPEVRDCFSDILDKNIRFYGGDAEKLSFPKGQNLITSCSAIQWFEDPEAFFKRCRYLLAEGGYLAFSTFGKENMREITSVTGVSLPYRSLKELERSLSKDYELVYSGEEVLCLTFSSPLEVLRHLKQTGVTGINRNTWTKADLSDFCHRYMELYEQSDTTVPLTYHPIYIIVKKK